MTTSFKWGSEFLVNTTTSSYQNFPSMTGLTNGRFVMTWRDTSGSPDDPFGSAVRSQVFNANGSKFGSEFLVNTKTTGNQSDPTITALADGRFVVAFTDYSPNLYDPEVSAIRAQVYYADGSKSGAEFTVVENWREDNGGGGYLVPPSADQPSLTALGDGRFMMTYLLAHFGLGGQAGDLMAQMFNADGSKSGSEILVTHLGGNNALQYSVTMLTDGSFVAVYTREEYYVGPTNVLGQVFNADGSKSGGEFFVNADITGYQSAPSVTALADGHFVVAFTDYSQSPDDPSRLAVRAQVFNADGGKSGAEFLVNTTTTESQNSPSITALADGRFVVVFHDGSHSSDDSSGLAIRAQVFNADGTKSGSEFLVNTTTDGDQSDPSISVLADGRFAVTWTDGSGSPDDSSATAVRGQIFDPRVAAVHLKGTVADDDYYGTRFCDVMYGSFGNDTLTGVADDDRLFGQGGDDRLRGNLGNDMLLGGCGDDVLRGGVGDDTLIGGRGSDTLNGHSGNDTLFGGADSDRFVFAPGHGTARIADFEDGVDKIRFSAYGFADANEAMAFATDAGCDVVFAFDTGDVLTVDNITVHQFAAEDFIL